MTENLPETVLVSCLNYNLYVTKTEFFAKLSSSFFAVTRSADLREWFFCAWGTLLCGGRETAGRL
jgi:hypothetical protein